MNKPIKSKINWTALLMHVTGLFIAFGVIPEEAREPVTEVVLIVGPLLIGVFRTWFTGNKT